MAARLLLQGLHLHLTDEDIEDVEIQKLTVMIQ